MNFIISESYGKDTAVYSGYTHHSLSLSLMIPNDGNKIHELIAGLHTCKRS